jgi:Ca-activated chloride channel family protein
MALPDSLTGRRTMRTVLMNVEVDEALLQEISGRTGGRFYKATDRESLRSIFDEIDRLERTPIRSKRYIRYRESFQPLVWAALGLMLTPLLAGVLGLTVEP